jgi:hypothetical protein
MSLFEPPPEPPKREASPRHRFPNAWGPPDAALPGVVPLEKIIGRTDDVAVALSRLEAYPEGFAFEVVTIARIELDLEPFGYHLHRRRKEGTLDPELLRFGIQFSDGRKARIFRSSSG